MSTQKGWDAWFAGDAKKLVEKHTKDAKANAYFTNPAFKGHSKHLHDFLKEYASDSGNVPSCG